MKTVAALSAAAIVIASAYVWQTRSAHEPEDVKFGRVTKTPAVASDVSTPLSMLSTLSPPDENDPDAAAPENETSEARSSAPIRTAVSQASAAVEQLAPGTKPAAILASSFDGLGVGFEGPNGSGRGGNPSDNALAVGPNHIVQIVNGRGIAVFTKKGKKYDFTDPQGNPDRLFVFHRDVDKARARLKRGDPPALP